MDRLLKLLGVTRLRLARPAAPVVATRGVVYVPGSPHPKHRLDVFAPSKAQGAPVVHFVHGGFWTEGDRSYHRLLTGLYASLGRALAAQGVVTVVQSYRLVPEVAYADVLGDVVLGLDWTARNVARHGGDPSRLFLMGHSAGGQLAATVALDDDLHRSRVRGCIALSAIWDLEDLHAAEDEAFHRRVTYRVFGRDPERWRRHSPVRRAADARMPFLLMVGERDYPYLVPQAVRAAAELQAPLEIARGLDHDDMVLTFGTRGDPLTPRVSAFVRG